VNPPAGEGRGGLERRPLVRLRLFDAESELLQRRGVLALVLLNLGPPDARPERHLAVAREPRLTKRLVGDRPGLVEPAGQPEQHDLLVQCRQAAQLAELLEPLGDGAFVDPLAKSGGVVAGDDAQFMLLMLMSLFSVPSASANGPLTRTPVQNSPAQQPVQD
jgi:hypothetical protein